MIHFHEHIFQMGWLNHQLDLHVINAHTEPDGETETVKVNLLTVKVMLLTIHHGNLRGPPQCHVYPQEIAGLMKGLLTIGFP